jgi:hypothetical protein
MVGSKLTCPKWQFSQVGLKGIKTTQVGGRGVCEISIKKMVFSYNVS